MKFLSQINVNTEYILPFVDGTNGQVLTTDGNGAVYWGSVSAGATNLNALTDVELTSPSTGQILRYEIPMGGSVPVWRNVTPGYLDPNSSINALGDVVITSATSGQILQFNGTFWINTTLSTVEYVSKVQHTVKAGVAITKGQAVYVTTSDGTNMVVGLASNASEATSSKVIGLAASNAAINDQIFVVTEGLLAGLNTSTATAGDPVWLGANGNLIFGLLNKPVAPAHLVYIGVVTRVQQNNGEIFVNVQNGFELNEIHDALITSPTAGQLLRRDSDNLWKNWTPNYLTAESDTLATVTARGATTTGNIVVNGEISLPSFIRLTNAGANNAYISESWGINLNGASTHPIQVRSASLSVGYTLGAGTSYGSGNLFVSDKIGVNTTAPTKALDVVGSGIVASFGGVFSTGSFAGIHFGYSETQYGNDNYKKSAIVFERTDNHGQGGNASGKIHFLLNNIGGGSATSLAHSVMVIDTNSTATQGSARVGIGTTSPNSTLDVNGAANATSFSSTALFIANADTSGSLQPDQGSPANKIYSFRWAGGEQGYIDTDAKITFAGFKTPTGTASQFLKANGTVDSNVYITSAALSGYATQAWVNSNFYTQGQIDDFFGGAEPISGYNKSNWDAAYNDKVNSASFNTTNGILTLTQQDGGTVTVDLDGRYLTSDTDAQTLTWDGGSKTLGITNGNDVILSELATEDFVTSQGYVTSSHTHTIANVTGLQTALDGKMPYYHNAIGGDPGTAINGVTRIYPTANGPIGAGHFTVFTALQDSVNYGWQFTSVGNDAYFRSKDTTWGGWQTIATQSWVQAQGYITGYTETDTLATVTGRGASTSSLITINSSDVGLKVQENGTSLGWRGRIGSFNSSANKSSFLGNYTGRAGVFGHNNALTSWDDLWVNTLGIYGHGNLYLSWNTYVKGNGNDTNYSIWHAGNDGSGSGLDADLIDGIDSSSILWGNAKGTNDSITTDADGLDKTGFYTSSAFVTRPESVDNWMYIQHIKLYNNNSLYQKQIGYDTYDDRMWVRTRNAGVWTSWKEIVTSDNIGSYALTSLPAHTHTIADVTGLQTALDGKVPTTRTLTINGTAYDLSANRSWTISTNDSTKVPIVGDVEISGMKSFTTNVSSQEDWQNSPISILERDGIGSGSASDIYSPNINFHWRNRVSRSIWMDASGGFHFGEYSATGVPSNDSVLYAGGGDSSRWNDAYSWGNHAGLYAAASHTHTIANVTGLQTALDGKLSTSGKAADSEAVDGIDSSRIVFGDGANGRSVGRSNGSANTSDSSNASGFYYGYNVTGMPTSDWWNWLTVRGEAWSGSDGYQFQIAGSFWGDDYRIRRMTSGTNHAWVSIIHSGNIGSQSVNYANSAGSATTAGTASQAGFVTNQSGQLLRFDNRIIAPNETNAAYMQFGFTSWNNNNTAPWADYLHLRSYEDGSGGSDNLVMFKKSGIGMRIWQQSWGSSTAYSSYADVWTTENFTSTNVTNWNAAYGWGNHADAPYWNVSSTDPKDVESTLVTFRGDVTILGTLTESSSIRLKENITPLDPALDKVNQLEAVSYNKIGVDNREIGLIAEDVAELFPEVVTYNEEGQPQGIQYQRLSVILLKALQELSQEVNELKKKLN